MAEAQDTNDVDDNSTEDEEDNAEVSAVLK